MTSGVDIHTQSRKIDKIIILIDWPVTDCVRAGSLATLIAEMSGDACMIQIYGYQCKCQIANTIN